MEYRWQNGFPEEYPILVKVVKKTFSRINSKVGDDIRRLIVRCKILVAFIDVICVPQICGVTDRTISYSETYRNILRLSESLHRRGYRQGDAVAAVLPNCLEMPTLVHACAARGIVTTTMNPLYTEGKTSNMNDRHKSELVLLAFDTNPATTEVCFKYALELTAVIGIS